MLPDSPQQSISFPEIMATPEKVRETLEMLGWNFSEFEKYHACRISKDRKK